jgi:hypothetical protein
MVWARLPVVGKRNAEANVSLEEGLYAGIAVATEPNAFLIWGKIDFREPETATWAKSPTEKMTTREFAGKVPASGGVLLVRLPLRYERRFRLTGVSENAPADDTTDRDTVAGEVSLEPNAPNEGHLYYLLLQPSWDGHTYTAPGLPSSGPPDGAPAAGPRSATQPADRAGNDAHKAGDGAGDGYPAGDYPYARPQPE